MGKPKPKPITNVTDPRYAKALAHPLRVRILAMLEEEKSSPVVLAERLDASLPLVAYHVRTLSNLGLIELVGTRPRRGATEHYYEAREHPRITDEAWEQIGVVTRQRLLSSMLQQIGEYATGSAAAGGFDRADAHITRTAMKLDERGWTELAAATKTWLEQTAKIEAAAEKRLEKAGADAKPLDVGLVMLLFEALPFTKRARKGKARPAEKRSEATKSAATRNGRLAPS